MIVTLTLNPTLDRTVTIDTLRQGGLNRISHVRLDASGKGINVSKALRRLRLPSLAMGFLGGGEGKYIADDLDKEEILTKFTWLETGATRVNVKVLAKDTGQITELNEPGPLVGGVDLDHLREDLHGVLGNCDYLVCSGSRPPGVEEGIYAELLQTAQSYGAKVVLDTDGPALKAGLQARPFMLKPNLFEAEQLLGFPLRGDDDYRRAVDTLLNMGVGIVILSLGAEGAIFAQPEGAFHLKAPVTQVRSTVGCGDALVAAVLAGLTKEKSWDEIIRFAICYASATAATEGTTFPSEEEAQDLLSTVEYRSFI